MAQRRHIDSGTRIRKRAHGNKPRRSKSPSESRMMTWRLKGILYDWLIDAAEGCEQSLNEYVTKVMVKHMQAEKAKEESK